MYSIIGSVAYRWSHGLTYKYQPAPVAAGLLTQLKRLFIIIHIKIFKTKNTLNISIQSRLTMYSLFK